MQSIRSFGPFLAACIAVSVIPGSTTAERRRLHPVVSTDSVITLPAGSVIAAEGDSITYGQDASASGGRPPINDGVLGRSISPFPETLAVRLQRCPVVNRGYPGDRSVEGLVRWQDASPTDLTILMFGTNDAMNRPLGAQGPVNVQTFRFTLTELIERRRRAGSHVVLITPPPIAYPELNALIDPYREEVQAIGERMGLLVVDAGEALQDVETILAPDGVHLSPEANRELADTLATVLRCG